MMFKTGVKPKWEDPVNLNGGDFRIDIGIKEDAVLQKIWEVMVFSPLTGAFPRVKEGLSGIRFTQKTKQNSLNTYRLEVWVTSGQQDSEINKEINKFLEEKILKDILSQSGGMVPDIKWSAHH